MIEYCRKGFIRFEDDLTIKLLETTRLTYHYELRTLDFYLEYVEGKNFEPFMNTTYIMEYGLEGHSHVYIGDWIFERKSYQLKVYFDGDNYFGIEFSKSKGEKEKSEYSDKIIRICNELNFNFDTEFFITTKEAATAFEIVSETVDKFKAIS